MKRRGKTKKKRKEKKNSVSAQIIHLIKAIKWLWTIVYPIKHYEIFHFNSSIEPKFKLYIQYIYIHMLSTQCDTICSRDWMSVWANQWIDHWNIEQLILHPLVCVYIYIFVRSHNSITLTALVSINYFASSCSSCWDTTYVEFPTIQN